MADSQRKTANLFSATLESGSISGTDGQTVDNNARVRTNDYIWLDSGNYTFSVKNPTNYRAYYFVYDTSGNFISRQPSNWSYLPMQMTIGSAQKIKIILRWQGSDTEPIQPNDVVEMMINTGDTALPYQPYSSTGWFHSLRKLTTATEAVENPLYSDGTAITSYTIKGNTVQNGTPTPSNPVAVNGVGVRTENLYNPFTVVKGRVDSGVVSGDSVVTIDSQTINSITFTVTLQYRGIVTDFIPIPNDITRVTFSFEKSGENTGVKAVFYDGDKSWISDADGSISSTTMGFTVPTNTAYMRIVITAQAIGQSTISKMMLVYGWAALPFEPYGYKIPISNGQQTTNIYLGSTQTYREINKLVLKGDETWTETDGSVYISSNYFPDLPVLGASPLYCTHFPNDNTGMINGGAWWFRTFGYTAVASDVTTWKAYLAQQYAAGTPVTVWYVLATAETGIVNEPLMKIGDYADTLSNATAIPTTEGANSITVDTTVQPSEFTATWTGWHNAEVKEKSENLFDKDNVEIYEHSNLGSTNVWAYDTTATGKTIRIPCAASTQYTLSIDSTLGNTVFRVAAIESETVPVSGQTGQIPCITLFNDGTASQATITTSSGAKYLIIQFSSAMLTDVLNSFMLNAGSTALPYEPYWK